MVKQKNGFQMHFKEEALQVNIDYIFPSLRKVRYVDPLPRKQKETCLLPKGVMLLQKKQKGK